MVVLPEPLTPITRITCGRGKAPDFQRLGDRSEDLLDLLGEDRAKPALVEPLEFLAGNRLADPVRRFRAEVGGDQRFLDVVERRRVERGAAGQAGEIVGDPVGGLLEPAAQAVEPTHAQTAVSMIVAVRAMIRAGPHSPRVAPAKRDRREIVGVARAVAFDQHRLRRADEAVEPAPTALGGGFSQPGSAGLDQLARELRHARRRRVGRGEKGKM